MLAPSGELTPLVQWVTVTVQSVTLFVCVCEGHGGGGGDEVSPDHVPPDPGCDLQKTPGPGRARPPAGFLCALPAMEDLSCQGAAAVLCLMCRSQQVVKGETHKGT